MHIFRFGFLFWVSTRKGLHVSILFLILSTAAAPRFALAVLGTRLNCCNITTLLKP